MHRTLSSLRGRLDTNNLRTSKTITMKQSMINFGTMQIRLNIKVKERALRRGKQGLQVL
jgi:hypothetical protein